MAEFTLKLVCSMLAVRYCWNNGHTIPEIAKVAKVSQGIVRSWLITTGVSSRTIAQRGLAQKQKT